MARKMTEWPSKRGPITKIMPSDGCIGDTVPLAVGKWYDFHEFGWYMGNVGLATLSPSSWLESCRYNARLSGMVLTEALGASVKGAQRQGHDKRSRGGGESQQWRNIGCHNQG